MITHNLDFASINNEIEGNIFYITDLVYEI